MRIYIMTDMEGCAGVLNFEEYESPGNHWYRHGVQILTEETNAAIMGFFEGGATEAIVADGHGAGAVDPLRLDPRAELVRGTCLPPHGPYPFGLEASCQGIAWIGQHAKAGTDYSHLTHTGSCLAIDFQVNGISIGEYGQMALCAMELGVPSILACGEKALCAEAAALTPGVVTVSVKAGLSPDGYERLNYDEYRRAKLAARHLSHARACDLIRKGAKESVERLQADRSHFRYPRLKPPYVREARFRAKGEQPPFATRDEHPTSLIALLNKESTRL